MQAKTKNRMTIIFTVLLFTTPVVVAYLLSSGLIDYHPEDTKNNGHFVSPLVKVADYSDAAWVAGLAGHWTLIRRTPVVCANQCQSLENDLHKYRLSMGHRAEKLSLMLIADGFNSEVPDKFPHIKKVSIAGNKALQSVFEQLSEVSLLDGQGMYVVAPEGYLMMAFTPENTSTDIIRDLSLLVKRKGD
ncbi:hypothetical protein MNBD_GAMMA02-575 [hydrothermal vent metagenome]|uniref:Transmembrane protein n=1 Tax=hydrothermal vent metagenome TaxID=652676 RepID=A0A3B0VVY1_9ZZZZ